MKVGVSNGEVLDKLSILEIKIDNITDELKLGNIKKEHAALRETIGEPDWFSHIFRDYGYYDQLKELNERLWDIEDAIRIKERDQEFDKEFVNLARSVYKTNDKRAEMKKEINLYTESELIEEKSYEDYSQ